MGEGIVVIVWARSSDIELKGFERDEMGVVKPFLEVGLRLTMTEEYPN